MGWRRLRQKRRPARRCRKRKHRSRSCREAEPQQSAQEAQPEQAPAPAEKAEPADAPLPAAAQKIEIPAGWSHDALAFAVEHSILSGYGDGQLHPTDSATRAQMATMLTVMVGAVDGQKQAVITPADLSAFQDLANGWYTPYVAAAVQLGIFYGTSATAFSPEPEDHPGAGIYRHRPGLRPAGRLCQ